MLGFNCDSDHYSIEYLSVVSTEDITVPVFSCTDGNPRNGELAVYGTVSGYSRG